MVTYLGGGLGLGLEEESADVRSRAAGECAVSLGVLVNGRYADATG